MDPFGFEYEFPNIDHRGQAKDHLKRTTKLLVLTPSLRPLLHCERTERANSLSLDPA